VCPTPMNCRRERWRHPQVLIAEVTRSSQTMALYSFFGLLIKKAYTSTKPSVVRTRPARARTLLGVPVLPRTTPRPARLLSS
jgi:hypothetical protein